MEDCENIKWMDVRTAAIKIGSNIFCIIWNVYLTEKIDMDKKYAITGELTGRLI